jgi:triacylglycerol lipase
MASGIAVEAGWMTAHLLMYPMGMLPESAVRAARGLYTLRGLSPQQRGLVHHGVDAAATPILLVHGIIDNHSIFAVLDKALRRRGFTDVSSFDYGLFTTDVRTAASALEKAIEKLSAESGYERVHVIGHSLGGLVARYYVQRMRGYRRVHTCVTMGTPHQGTALARIGRMLPLVRQLAPGSELLTELSEPAPGCTTRFLAFYSDLDHLIVPKSNARIEHPDLDVSNVAVHGVGHLSMPNDGRIGFHIASALRGLEPDGTDVRPR